MGNKDNYRKLILGRNWGTENKETKKLDDANFRLAIEELESQGVITKEDWDYVQEVWDIYESIKPLAQKAHFKIHGYYFNEVTSQEIETSYGKYRGGYVPAIVDYSMVKNKKAEDGGTLFVEGVDKYYGSDMFPPAHFTKDRVDHQNPLDIDIANSVKHLDKVLVYSYLHPQVKDIYNLLTHENPENGQSIKNSLDAVDPAIWKNFLKPWMERVVRQQTVREIEDDFGKKVSKAFRFVRQSTVADQMFLNLPNTLEQIFGVFPAVQEAGAKNILSAIKMVFLEHKNVSSVVNEKSSVMRNRDLQALSMQDEISSNLLSQGGKFMAMRDWIYQKALFLQIALQKFIDRVVWNASMLKNQQKIFTGEMTEQDAIFEADNLVERTQGSYTAESMSNIEVRSELTKPLFMYLSFFNNITNLSRSKQQIINRTAESKSDWVLKTMGMQFSTIVAPAMASYILREAISGSLVDDDDSIVDDALRLASSPLEFFFRSVPIGGEVVTSLYRTLDDRHYNDDIRLTPIASQLVKLGNMLKTFSKVFTGDDVAPSKLIDALAAPASFVVPTKQVSSTVGFGFDMGFGYQNLENWWDLMQGILTGHADR